MTLICTYGKAGWMRLGKYVLQWKHKSNPPLFSERNGYIRYIHIGSYRFNFRKDTK